jgi:hypothetical protein
LLVPLVLVAAAGLALSGAVADAEEKTWFDTEKCAFCRQVGQQAGLLESMKTEYHDARTGIISVAYVGDDHWDEFGKARQGMQKVAEEMQSGTMPYMCGHCETLGSFYGRGVQIESIRSEKCILSLYSSADSGMVAELQAFGRRCAAESARWRAAAGKK